MSLDRRLYREDIRASIAHAEMLARCGLLAKAELVEIREGLRDIEKQIEEGTFEFQVPLEDVPMLRAMPLEFPDDSELARVLPVHYPLTYEKLAFYDFDPNATLLYALELLPELGE